MIPYGRQDITEADVDAVVGVLRSDFLTQGPAVPALEQAICEYSGATHAVASNSATSALHLACMALELGPGDRLWTTPISFVASANCGLYCGACVEFVDVDPTTGLISLDALRDRLSAAERDGRLPKVLVVVHLAGHLVNMRAVSELVSDYGVRIVEDASHAIGSAFDGDRTGKCVYSDICVFSFHPVKVITAAEAGVSTTNDRALALRMSELRSHGITRDPARFQFPGEGAWYYEQQALGLNYRLSDLHAALGHSQLQRLDQYVDKRIDLARRYVESLESVTVVEPAAGVRSAWHLAIVRCGSADRRARLFTALRAADIGVNVHYIPIYRQPYYRQLGFRSTDYPGSEAFYSQVLSLPLYPMLDEDNQQLIIRHVNEFFQKP
jgi:UDP-4-amino-4,6-dideoxy-N-acetyl-beta-L-altrosamine transaminase